MSLELRPLVAEAKSFASTSATFIPRNEASRKIDAPVIPPPTIRRSNFSCANLRKIAGREPLLNVYKLICAFGASLRLCDKNVVEVIATRLNFCVQAVEAAVLDHGFVHIGGI